MPGSKTYLLQCVWRWKRNEQIFHIVLLIVRFLTGQYSVWHSHRKLRIFFVCNHALILLANLKHLYTFSFFSWMKLTFLQLEVYPFLIRTPQGLFLVQISSLNKTAEGEKCTEIPRKILIRLRNQQGGKWLCDKNTLCLLEKWCFSGPDDCY